MAPDVGGGFEAEFATLAAMARAVSNEINLQTSLTAAQDALALAEEILRR